MPKRRNEHNQLRKEDNELVSSMTEEAPIGRFDPASEEQLQQRRRAKVSSPWKSIESSAAAAAAVSSSTATKKKETEERNPFANISFASATTAPPPKLSFHPLPTQPFIPLDPATKTNLKVLHMCQLEKISNPISDWSFWIRQAHEEIHKIEDDYNDTIRSKGGASTTDTKPYSVVTSSGNIIGQQQQQNLPTDKVSTMTTTSDFSYGMSQSVPPMLSSSDPGTDSSNPFSFVSASATKPAPSTGFSFQLSSKPASEKPFARTDPTVPSETSITNNSNNNNNQKEEDEEEGQPMDLPSQVAPEENTMETILCEVNARYYKWQDSKWKAYTLGTLRLYQNKIDATCCRMVMRNEVGKVQLNLRITKGMKFIKSESKGKGYINFVAIQNSDVGVETFMLKLSAEKVEKLFNLLTTMAN